MMFQPQAPGRAGSGEGAPAQAAPATEGAPAPADGEGAPPAESPSAFGGMALLLPFLLLFGLLFLMNRGEKKKRAALESKLKRGDRVVTRSGIKGKLVEVQDASVKVEIAPGVTVVMVKTAVEGLDPGDSVASGKAAGGKDQDKDKSSKDKSSKDKSGKDKKK